MGDGAKTQFWEDTWIDQSPLAIKFHRLYNTTFTKHVIVKQIKDGLLISIQFRIYLFCMMRQLINGKNYVRW